MIDLGRPQNSSGINVHYQKVGHTYIPKVDVERTPGLLVDQNILPMTVTQTDDVSDKICAQSDGLEKRLDLLPTATVRAKFALLRSQTSESGLRFHSTSLRSAGMHQV